MTPRILTAALTAVGLVFGTGAATTASAQQTPTTAPAPAASYSDDDLRSFAKVALKVEEIRTQAEAEMQGLSNPEDVQRANDETLDRMVKAVEDEPGMDVDQYNRIARASMQDRELAEKIGKFIREEQQGSG